MTKAISRLPHQLSSNSKKDGKKEDAVPFTMTFVELTINVLITATKDPVYDALEERFNTKVKQVETFSASVTTFRDQTCSLVDFQQVPSWLDIIDSTNCDDVPEESSRAYQDYAMAMEYCSQEVRQMLVRLWKTRASCLY
jgi:hypothetical protein